MLGVDEQFTPKAEGIVDGFSRLAFRQVSGSVGLELESDALEDRQAFFLTNGTAVFCRILT